MKKLWTGIGLIALVLFVSPAHFVTAQEAQNAAATADEQQEKAEREKKALILLEQIAEDAQLLRLPENRVSLQINTADLLWDRNQARARTLFAGAGDTIAEMMRSVDPNERRNNQARRVNQLRQQLVWAAARHDAPLAYHLLAITRPVTPSTVDPGNQQRTDSEDNLEQGLLARIAMLDPKLALQNAEQFLDKGQFPRTLSSVLNGLQRKDKEAADKLEEKLVKRLQSTSLLANNDAGGLALSLLRPGPRAEAKADAASKDSADNEQPVQFLAQSRYVDLMGNVIDAALKATGQGNTGNQRTRGRGQGIATAAASNGGQTAPTDAQIEQANARALLNGLQSMLPNIDQYLPYRAQPVREKLTELGMVENQRAVMNQMFDLMRQGSSESLLNAAPSAPAQMQPRIYQQAAMKALDEGNADQARKIASDHLQGASRDRVLQQVELRQISQKTEASRLDELRQTLASLRSDEERVDLLIQLSENTREKDPKLALQLLEQAKQLTARRATSYQQFEQQLRVADSFRELEPARSFEVLEPGIAQLNELLSAAATLSGFEVNVFREGEFPLDSRNNLGSMISRYGQALGRLAREDFDRAQALANRFQLAEPRIIARMSIVQNLLGSQPNGPASANFRIRGPNGFARPPQ